MMDKAIKKVKKSVDKDLQKLEKLDKKNDAKHERIGMKKAMKRKGCQFIWFLFLVRPYNLLQGFFLKEFMVKKIAITGTHGAGKTTLCFMMAGYYKKLGYNVNVVQEVARKCPFPINENMSEEAVLWIYHEHVKTELEVSRNHDIVISDRTFYDSFIYGRLS